MIRKILATAAIGAMLVTPSIAFADPPGSAPGQESNNRRLDLYEFDTTQEVEAAMKAAGYDVVSSEVVEGDDGLADTTVGEQFRPQGAGQ